MIAFATFFLGLVLGSQTVELAVGGEVARVDLLLDGRVVARIEGPPWAAGCDFGDELIPHELVAVAYDEEGGEVGRARQWINLPRPPAEVGIVLDGGRGGVGRVARLTWESVLAARPQAVEVSFDGRPLPVADPRRIELPPHDPEQLHLLRAEVDFSDHVSSVAEVVFGGTYADQVASELTAVPVVVARGEGDLPAAAVQGALTKGGEGLEVVTVEAGPGEVVVVRDEAARAPLSRIDRHLSRMLRALGMPGRMGAAGQLRHAMPLGEGQRLQLQWPYPEFRGEGSRRYALFPSTPAFSPHDVGVYWALTRLEYRGGDGQAQQLADAVAVAGMSVAARKRRRAVVLLLSRDPADASKLSPALVRRYLSHLQVPLFVWSAERKPGPGVEAWGAYREVASPTQLDAAVREVAKAVDRQRIVWIRGLHLPHEISLAAGAHDLELAR